MNVELTDVQLVGVIVAITGLLLNNVGILYFYFRITRILKKNGIKPDAFPPLAFYYQLRLLIRTVLSREKKKEYQGILIFLHWLMLLTVGMILLGIVLVLLG
ncbi:hypothetical protein D3C87_196740 [compost metagenome]